MYCPLSTRPGRRAPANHELCDHPKEGDGYGSQPTSSSRAMSCPTTAQDFTQPSRVKRSLGSKSRKGSQSECSVLFITVSCCVCVSRWQRMFLTLYYSFGILCSSEMWCMDVIPNHKHIGKCGEACGVILSDCDSQAVKLNKQVARKLSGVVVAVSTPTQPSSTFDLPQNGVWVQWARTYFLFHANRTYEGTNFCTEWHRIINVGSKWPRLCLRWQEGK